MAAKAPSILADPRYLRFRERYYDNFHDYVLENCNVVPTWQQMEFIDACQRPGARVAVSSGHGCFGKGTPILMYDGAVKAVEDVCVGDVLMGDDSTPRNVLELCRGRENLYRFTFFDGTQHVFNESHIICLVATQTHGAQRAGDKKETTVRDYLSWSDRKRRTHASYRVSCDFAQRQGNLPIPPYILGIWLGDGCSTSQLVTNPDAEIRQALKAYADDNGYTYRQTGLDIWVSNEWKPNGFKSKLAVLNLLGNKHIPKEYLTSCAEDRKELLAGLVDTDGTLDKRTKRVLSITQKNERIADGIVFLARSLGIHATKKCVQKTCKNTGVIGSYFVINLTRNIENIPIRIERKRPTVEGKIQRANLHFGVKSVEPLGSGEYFGFMIDGNRRFLSGDFMVLHNTGKSFLLAWLLDWNMRVFPHSNAILTATNIEQARSVVWKYLDGVIDCMDSLYPWMRGFFIKETRRYYARGFKDSWYVLPKTASKNAPENLAGQHNNNLLIVVDEASGVDDAIHGVLRGALTHRRNRYVMTSQPTRPAGHFADAMRKLAKGHGEDGIYDAITMNSEESPIVSREYILEKLQEYGGHHSPEYQIKVLGNFPDNMAGYLIPRRWVEDCQYNAVEFPEGDWGYVLLADVAEGLHRDSSVANIVRMSGQGDERRVASVECSEFLDMNEKQFARFIASKYYELPNLSIAVDGDGAGRTVILELEELGIPVQAIHWGLPCHTAAAQRRYANLRAFAYCKLRDAIFQKRFQGPQ
ncbi:MAG: hypothetical protein J5960_04020 [Desulfovibrio sp.]|nr:hypothetical protein [Desulfovibrio sp.]